MLNIPTAVNLLIKDKKNILIAGIGGGFDVYAGLPLYYAMLKLGKNVHLANYSFTDFKTIDQFAEPQKFDKNPIMYGANANIKAPCPYYPEGYLSLWFKEKLNEDKTVWMFNKVGPKPLKTAVNKLVENLKIDAIILIDGGVDSIMTGDEEGAGTLLEDSISLAAYKDVPKEIPKILMCVGMGTEVEEKVCNHNALLNMAVLSQDNAFYGSCSLVSFMKSFQFYKNACQFVFEQPGHRKSHISTRIIPAAEGMFGNYHMYQEEVQPEIFVSPLMSVCWFFNADAVIYRNKIIPLIEDMSSFYDCTHEAVPRIKNNNVIPRRNIPM